MEVLIPTEEENLKNDNDIKEILPAKLIPFKNVFDEKSANELPPHRPYDCEIKLKSNVKLHYGAIYPLTEKETLAFKKYIKEARAKGFIRNSKSPFGASVFFVPKKDHIHSLSTKYINLIANFHLKLFPKFTLGFV